MRYIIQFYISILFIFLSGAGVAINGLLLSKALYTPTGYEASVENIIFALILLSVSVFTCRDAANKHYR